jgi:MFS family permease
VQMVRPQMLPLLRALHVSLVRARALCNFPQVRSSGILVSLSNGATFIGAPILGLLSDSVGRRIFLIVSATSLALDLLSLAASPSYIFAIFMCMQTHGAFRSVTLLYVTRPLFGFFNAAVAVSAAYCADVVGAANRARGTVCCSCYLRRLSRSRCTQGQHSAVWFNS